MPVATEDRLALLEQRYQDAEDRMDRIEQVALAVQERAAKEAMLNLPDTFTVTTRQFGELTFSVFHPSHYKIELLIQTIQGALESLEVPDEEPTVSSLLGWFNQSLTLLHEQGAMDHYYRALRIILDPVADPDPASLSIPLEQVKCAPATLVWQAWFKKITPFFSMMREIVVMSLRAKAGLAGQDSASPSQE